MHISCNHEVEGVTTRMGRFDHVLLEINLTEKVSDVASIAGTIIAVVYVEVTENDTLSLHMAQYNFKTLKGLGG